MISGPTRPDPGAGDRRPAVRRAPDPQRGGGRDSRSGGSARVPLRRGRLPLLRRPLRAASAHPLSAAHAALLRAGDTRQGDGHIVTGPLSALGLLSQRGASEKGRSRGDAGVDSKAVTLETVYSCQRDLMKMSVGSI